MDSNQTDENQNDTTKPAIQGEGNKPLPMRLDIKDQNGKFIDNFVTYFSPIVGDFLDVKLHGVSTTYKVVERRLSLEFFQDKETKLAAQVRRLDVIVRPQD